MDTQVDWHCLCYRTHPLLFLGAQRAINVVALTFWSDGWFRRNRQIAVQAEFRQWPEP